METQSITPEAAEREVVERVLKIDALRTSNRPDRDRAIAVLDAEIVLLKKVTGPRQASGVAHIVLPVPGGGSAARAEDFDEWNKSG